MAAPLAKFKCKIFSDPVSLAAYVTATSSDVLTITSIVCDSSGKYILFYMTP